MLKKSRIFLSCMALAGAGFGIYNSANTRIGGLTTNSDGYAKSGLLPYGDGYYLLEEKMSAPVIKCKKTPNKKCRFLAERRNK